VTDGPLVIAHRGACGYRPEHSRAAYELAIEQGADMLEPDVVVTKDGVLVIRHENEISGTTDVADHPEFADRRTVKIIDNEPLDGWFTEDFTWDELATLRCRERLSDMRLESRAFDGQFELLRLTDLLRLVDAASRAVSLCIELKHATYFDDEGLALDELLARDLTECGWKLDDSRLVIESFEKSILVIFQIDAVFQTRHGAPQSLFQRFVQRVFQRLSRVLVHLRSVLHVTKDPPTATHCVTIGASRCRSRPPPRPSICRA
jgi:glycerophosphoryl diester phosphodiesterase